MKTLILTIIFTLTICTIVSGQAKKDSLELFDFKIDYRKISVINDQIYDTVCYQLQFKTPQYHIYTDTTIHCKARKSKMYFPLQYTSKVDTIKVDTSAFQDIYDGLLQFKEPLIWNSAELDNSIRITIFKDTLPEVFRVEISKDGNKVIKKTASFGHWFYHIDKGYTEEITNINQYRLNRIIKNIKEIIDVHNRYYDNFTGSKDVVIETKFDNNYEFIITHGFILTELKQSRKLRRILNLLE